MAKNPGYAGGSFSGKNVVTAAVESHMATARSLCRNPRRVALDACMPFGLQARPTGRPSGQSSRRPTVFGVSVFQQSCVNDVLEYIVKIGSKIFPVSFNANSFYGVGWTIWALLNQRAPGQAFTFRTFGAGKKEKQGLEADCGAGGDVSAGAFLFSG